MASLKKRGRYYYIKFSKTVNGEVAESVKSLGIRYKARAEEARQQLEKLKEEGEINPYNGNFNPQIILAGLNQNKTIPNIHTVREAADYFYKKKDHLSDKTVANTGSSDMNKQGAYEQAIEHFISLNDIADLPPEHIQLSHFEAVIFKKGLATSSRHFYFRQLRVWWNVLLRKNIVTVDFFEELRKDLPEKKTNTRPKMLSEEELCKLFDTFDKRLAKKRKQKHWVESQAQIWFKPLIATYFYTGMRKNEAAYDPDIEYSGLKGKNLVYEEREPVLIWLEATKGRKERYIPIAKELVCYLEDYMELRGSVDNEQYLFIYTGGSRKGWPVTGDRAYREFKRYLRLSGLPKSRTLHGMRHSRITNWIEDGYSLKEAGDMAGHSSQNVTQGYTHLAARHLLKKMRRIEQRKNNYGGLE